MLVLDNREPTEEHPIPFTEFQVVAAKGAVNIVVQQGFGEFWNILYVENGDDGACRLLGSKREYKEAVGVGRMIASALEISLTD